MGIDIYANWDGMTEAESDSQSTGFRIDQGHVGYLREAYHGGPYVTKYLLAEAFQSEDDTAEIPARVLRARLPAAVLMSMYRQAKVYGNGDPPALRLDASSDSEVLRKELLRMVESMSDMLHRDFARALTKQSLRTAARLIEARALPLVHQSFVDFVDLCERKERETGSPCRIIASY